MMTRHRSAVTLIIFTLLFSTAYPVSVEQDLTLTLNQKQLLDKFRQRVAPLLKHDYMKMDIYLVRWLRARDFNLDAAELLLTLNLKWRKEQNIDNILKEDFSDLVNDYPVELNTYDMEGRPVGALQTSDWNVRRAVIQGRSKRLMRYIAHNFENITQQVFERQARGMNVTQWKLLVNAEGFNLIDHGCAACLPLGIQAVGMVESYYPGWLDEFIIIQATPTVQAMFQFIRPFLRGQYKDSLHIFGSNRAQWMKYLDERISKSERYPSYGGTKTMDA